MREEKGECVFVCVWGGREGGRGIGWGGEGRETEREKKNCDEVYVFICLYGF